MNRTGMGPKSSSRTGTRTITPSKTDQEEEAAVGNQYASKTELLEWINGLLQLQLSRLEQFASGAVFCQMLDAYFKDAIPMHKVNYHATNEYESIPNYKVLQQGFTAITLTREIPVHSLVKGSRTDLLELLQYLYKYLLKLKAQEGYNARERRALAVRAVGVDTVPLPSWISGSQAAGRGGNMNRSSGNWGAVIEGGQGHGLRTSSSFSPPVARRTGAGSSPDKAADGTAGAGSRRPGAPSRIPSTSTNKTTAEAAPAQAAAATGPAATAAAAAAAAPEAAPGAAGGHAAGDASTRQPGQASTQALQEAAAEDETGAAVYQVLPQEEEGMLTRAPADGADSTTHLVIPDDVITSSMMRPLSPGSRAQMEVCLGAAEEAISVLQRTCVNMDQITTTLPTCTDSYAYRGKIRSLLDASATTAAHVSLLLSDAAAVCGRKPDGSVNELLASAQQLQQQLGKVNEQVDARTAQLQAALAAKPLSSTSTLNMQLTQLQKQVASTAALDGCLRAVGTACAALLGLSHREGAAVAKQFLQDTSSSSGQAPGSTLAAAPDTAGAVPAVSKVLKLGDCSMKQLRNGDIYKGRYQGLRKNGEGMYCFGNGDVYEGEFRDDRLAGSGVYLFAPEGRYEGDWSAALYEGHGSETFAKGSTYHGQYAAGLRHGWGVCRFFNGDYYEGEWSKGLRDGCGMQQCTDDSNYCGQYQRGKRHGYGVYSFPNGDQYLGEYVDDIPQGYGVYVFGSGQRYEGHWEKGKKHGWSIYTVETGQRWAGSWVEGKPQWVHPLVGEARGQQEASATPEISDNLTHAAAACKNGRKACALAAARLDAHWELKGDVQQGLTAAVTAARTAAVASQATRTRAQLLASRLDAAAMIIESCSKSAQMKTSIRQADHVRGVVVIGGTVLDIQAHAAADLLRGSSVLGHVQHLPGGVGRNIAEAAHHLLQHTRQHASHQQPDAADRAVLLISVIGHDTAADALLASFQHTGMSTNGILRCPSVSTPCVVALLDRGGEVAASVADVAAAAKLTPAIVQQHAKHIATAQLLILDANLQAATLAAAAHVAAAAGVPVLFEPVSIPKAARCVPFLHVLAAITPNAQELQEIANAVQAHHGLPPLQQPAGAAVSEQHSSATPQQLLAQIASAAAVVLQQGLPCILLTMGSMGAALLTLSSSSSSGQPSHRHPCQQQAGYSQYPSSAFQSPMQQDAQPQHSHQGSSLSAAALALLQPHTGWLAAHDHPSQHSLLQLYTSHAGKSTSCQHSARTPPGRCSIRAQHVPAAHAEVVNLSGAGDSLLGGFAAALVRGLDPLHALALGVAAARVSVECSLNVPGPGQGFDFESVRQVARELLEKQQVWDIPVTAAL